MRIEVDEQHIEEGVPHSFCNCPVAKALHEELQPHDISMGGVHVEADGTVRRIEDVEMYEDWDDIGDAYYRGPIIGQLDQMTVNWIQAFDDNDRVKPFAFEFERTA